MACKHIAHRIVESSKRAVLLQPTHFEGSLLQAAVSDEPIICETGANALTESTESLELALQFRRQPLVIAVQERDPLASGLFKSPPPGGRNTRIFLREYFDA